MPELFTTINEPPSLLYARTFVSLPAGHARIPFARFVPLTIAGCALWSAAFILAGDVAGEGWQRVASVAGHGSLVAAAVAIAALVQLSRDDSRAD